MLSTFTPSQMAAAILGIPGANIPTGYAPIGTVISYLGHTAPNDYLICDGTIYNIADYPSLATFFDAEYGASNYFGGDGTATFAVPDLRGEFLRGTGTNSHANQGSGASVGTHQDATAVSTWVSLTYQITVNDADSTFNQNAARWGQNNTTNGSPAAFTSRPTNTSVLFCIKARQSETGLDYSTAEQVVGTWIDGKPVYQTSFSGSFPTAAGWQTVKTIQDFDTLVDLFGYVVSSSTGMAIPLTFDSSLTFGCVSGAVKFYAASNILSHYSGRPLVFTIRYTKTTD